MKLGDLQRNGMIDIEGPVDSLNVSTMSQLTFAETEERCKATVGKFYWHGPVVYRSDGEDILLVAFGPCVVSYQLYLDAIKITSVWDTRQSLLGDLCLFWGDLQVAGELVYGICRNPNDSIPILVALNVSPNKYDFLSSCIPVADVLVLLLRRIEQLRAFRFALRYINLLEIGLSITMEL
jgi:hypothetical protein